ncbi:hypothetical protein [Shewanella algae]|uniref:hypothetical protein n=1 Tax=Shewanella algae TaxID=38313 RepID=UPI0031F51AE3
MIIIKENALVLEGDRFLYKGELFNGVVLALNNGVVDSRKLCNEGYICADYIPAYIGVNDADLVFDSIALDDEYEEPCTRDGALYSGLIYKFDGDICISEREYRDGWLVTEVNYRLDGTLECVDVGNDDISQKCSWFEDGSVEEFESFNRDIYRFWIKFSEKNVVNTLVIEGNYFSEVEQIREQLVFDAFINIDSFVSFSGSNYLFISGSGVNDEVFYNILAKDGLKQTKKLSVSNSAISSVALSNLLSLENIDELIFESTSVEAESLRAFKKNRPNCYVEFNGEVILS